MGIPAGSLDQRISILVNDQSTRDGFGALQENWVLFKKIWADMLYKNGSQYINADREQAQLVGSARVRMDKSILPTMRVQHGDIVFSIDAILPGRDRSYMDIAIKTINPEVEA